MARPDDHGRLRDAVVGSDSGGFHEGYFVLSPAYYSADLNAAGENLEGLFSYEFDVGLVFHGASVTAEAGERLRAFVEFAGKPE